MLLVMDNLQAIHTDNNLNYDALEEPVEVQSDLPAISSNE